MPSVLESLASHGHAQGLALSSQSFSARLRRKGKGEGSSVCPSLREQRERPRVPALDRPPPEVWTGRPRKECTPVPGGVVKHPFGNTFPGQLPRMPAAGVGYAASGSERSCSWEWTLPGSRKERLCQRQAAGGTASPCGGAGVGLAHGQGLVPSSPHPPWKGGGRSPEFGRPCKNPG